MELPYELISEIIGLLDSKTQLEVRLVSKDWLQANYYASLIFNWAEPGKVKDFVEHLVNYSFIKQIIFLKSKKMVKEDALALASLTNLRILKFSELYGTRFDLSTEEWMQFSVLTNLQEFHFNGNYPARLLTHFPYLHKLDLSVKDFSVADQIEVVSKATNLQSLALRYDKDVILSVSSVDRLTEVRAIAKLKADYGVDDADALEILTNLRSLSWDLNIIPHMDRLTKLQYLDITIKNPPADLLVRNQNLTGLKLNTTFSTQEFYHSLTSLYKLRYIAVHEIAMRYENFYFLTQLLHLEEFEATPKRAREYITPEVMHLIKSPNLTKLDCNVEAEYLTSFTNLHGLTCRTANGILSHLTKLTNLTVDTISHNFILTSLRKMHIKSSKPVEFLPNPHLDELIIDSELDGRLVPRLPAFKNITRLQFYFPQNPLSWYPIAKQLEQMTKIQRLQIRRVEEAQCFRLTELSVLTNLRILQVSGELTPEVRAHLTNIRHIDLV